MSLANEPIIPFKRKAEPLPELPGNLFVRLVTAKALSSLHHVRLSDVIERMWPDDILLRAASAPAQTTVTGWAAELARKIIVDALSSMQTASAGADLLGRGLVLSMAGYGQVSAPGFLAGAGNAGFVAENAPIPVRQLAVSPATLLPYKLATIAVLTREMMESGNADKLVTDALVRSCGPALDVALFDS